MFDRDPLRILCAASIGTGAAMHAAGLILARAACFASPWWMSAIYWTAILGYSASAVGILCKRRAALWFAVVGPLVGGALIFAGLLVPEFRFQILIPGTFLNELRPIGFVTLVVEPLAVLSGIVLLQPGPRRPSQEPGGRSA
jgi:hypothetical protein